MLLNDAEVIYCTCHGQLMMNGEQERILEVVDVPTSRYYISLETEERGKRNPPS